MNNFINIKGCDAIVCKLDEDVCVWKTFFLKFSHSDNVNEVAGIGEQELQSLAQNCKFTVVNASNSGRDVSICLA